MYRLQNFKHISTCSFQVLSRPNVSLNGSTHNRTFSGNSCTLCGVKKIGVSHSFLRHQSTSTSPAIKPKKPRKKRMKSNKKYAELLVVGESTTVQQKAKIQNLSGDDLKHLASTNINLSELYKLKCFTKPGNRIVHGHTYSNLTDINNIPSRDVFSSNFFADFLKTTTPIENFLSYNPSLSTYSYGYNIENIPVFCDKDLIDAEGEDLFASVNGCAFKPETNEEEIVEVIDHVDVDESREVNTNAVVTQTADTTSATEKPAKAPSQHRTLDPKARLEVISRTLSSYIEICAALKSPQRGMNALQFHRRRARRQNVNFPVIQCTLIYNALLKGFAAKGDWARMDEVMRCVREDHVPLNVQSYVAIFECLGRVVATNAGCKQLVGLYTREAKGNGISYDDIHNNGVFLYDQREVVLKAMRLHDPKYKPHFTKPNLQYKNKLVNQLNHDEQMNGIKERVPGEKGPFSKELLRAAVKTQIDIEQNVYVTIKSIESSSTPPSDDVQRYRTTLSEHSAMWELAASAAFTRDLAALTAQRSTLNMEPYLRAIPARDMVAIVVEEAQKIAQGSETYSPTTGQLYRDLGRKVYARYKVLRRERSGGLEKMMQIHTRYCDDYSSSRGKLSVLPSAAEQSEYLNPRQRWQWAEHERIAEGATVAMDHREWPPSAIQTVGKFLYNIVMHDVKIDVNSLRLNTKHKNYLPAFYTIFRNQGRTVKEEVKPHPILSRLYRASMPETLTFHAYDLPMKCPPVPWTSVQVGGYLVAPCEVVRLPSQAISQKERLNSAEPNQLYPSLDALNQLAAVPWKVNTNILDVIIKVFKSGGSAKLDVPEPPSSLDQRVASEDGDNTPKPLNFRQKLQIRRKKGEMYSLWCDCLYRLSLSNHFRKDIFWLPHNMDFRGRVYPIPPHLNHLGSDLARSTLVFAESRPLGPDGLNWLKLHLINLTGQKKRDPISERLLYAEQNLDLIFDSADKPLNGKMWWVESDEPWQTLACCMEITNAIRSGNPEKYRSHFPIHQDGSCNGLQHYAALGRDKAGALSVNLSPASEPQDVYSAVAALVEQRRQEDANSGLEIAKVLDGYVKRKVIKQTVMTTVYGVTRFGARLQIARQLKDIDEFPKEHVWSGSAYLTGRTFDSLRSMFTSTREIQDWFTDCARLISSVCGRNVEWVTPLGLPVVQPYFRYKKAMSNFYEGFHMDKHEKPNVMKQKNAFPPNFIHSLDSSHMMLTSLHAERAGITFVSVHDCYWTHPSTVNIMNKICREQFVALHSEPILEDLSVFLSDKYSYSECEFSDDGSVTDLTKKKLNRILHKLPRTGSFDIMNVLDSTYFFS